MNTLMNKPIALVLTGGIAACVALLPWSRWLGAQPDVDALLGQRVAEYARLRMQEDWVAVYGLTDSRDRKVVPLTRFLLLYGRGALKAMSLVEKSREVDVPNGTATVVMTLEAQLQLDKLPPETRRSLRGTSPADLQKSSDFPTEWYWADGNWWLRMDREAVTGMTADGKAIK